MILSRRLTIYLLSALGLAGLSLIGASFFSQLGCEGQLVNVNFEPSDEQQIWGDLVIGQSFIAPRNDLNRIDVMFQTYGRRNTEEVTFRLLELSAATKDPRQSSELFSTTFNAADVSDQNWRTFTFDKISNSAGKTYLMVLQSPASRPGNAITVGGIDKDIYAPGSAFLGMVEVPADIVFRACFQMTAFEKLKVLSEQLTRNRPGLWGNIVFYLLGLVSYGLLLIAFFWRLARSKL